MHPFLFMLLAGCDPSFDEPFDGDGDGHPEGSDCDDANEDVHPAAWEDCGDDIDNDCDELIDAEDPDAGAILVYPDYDDDGQGNQAGSPVKMCPSTDGTMPEGFVSNNTDCDDTNADVYLDAPALCGDALDYDCDGTLDDALLVSTWYLDEDGDGFGDPSEFYNDSCEQGEGRGGVNNSLDCDDGDAAVNPDAVDLCYDGLDANCDSNSDIDCDGDGYDAGQVDSDGDGILDTDFLGDDCDDSDAAVANQCLSDSGIGYFKGGGGCACAGAPLAMQPLVFLFLAILIARRHS